MASKTQFQQALQKPYDRLLFARDVLSKIFSNNLKILQNAKPVPIALTASERKVIDSASIYGMITLEDGTEITCYEMNLQNQVQIEQSKVAIQQYARKLLSTGQAALVNFVSPSDKRLWRLTLIAKDSYLSSDGVKEKTTNTKRYTFLLGPGESCRTASERLETLSIESTIDMKSLVKAFSVERLSKAFFDEYKMHYERFVHYLNESNFKKSTFNGNEKLIRDFTKKLLGRLVFLSFVQKKGWLGASSLDYKDGDVDFLMNLYLGSGADETFYEVWLKVLFFDTLNNRKGRQKDDFVMPDKTKVKIPFLNGGLFDREEIDEMVLTFEPRLFHNPNNTEESKERGFLDFLQAFNFTIHEDSPDDHTIAVDPEMLGHIFENLLEDNKDRGTYYTPKEIVHYMCQESLIQYIITSCDLERDVVEQVIRYKEVEKIESLTLTKIDTALDRVKICDPAIGSGAFPMGLLLEILSIKESIAYANNLDWQPAKIKENIIQESIYGIDIEKGAVDIARLRFWLSLVVDESTPRPLPNLDYKIMQGNSLLESYEDLDLCVRIEKETKLFRDDNQFSLDDINKLKDLVSKYFDTDSSDKKKELQQNIDDIVNKFMTGQVRDKVRRNADLLNDIQLKLTTANRQAPKTNADKKKKEDSIKKLSNQLEKLVDEAERLKKMDKDLKQIQKQKVYPYFLWHLWFSDIFSNGGFDIVIGNPPYIQLQKDGGELADLYQNAGYQTFDRMGDIYSLFYEKGWHLLKHDGSLCYITSNKWMRAGYGEATRGFLADNTNPLLLVDFPEQKIFESATVVTNILLFSRASNQGKTFACTVTEKVLKNLSVFVRQKGTTNRFSGGTSWAILSPLELQIKEKIERVGTPLHQWDIAINYGVKTGLNDAFIINGEQRKELIKQDPRSAEIIRPILRGRDIQRYKSAFAEMYLIATFPSLGYEIDDFPAIKGHLLTFGRELLIENGYSWVADKHLEEWCYKRLEQVGATITINGKKISFKKNEKSRKSSTNKWFETQDSISYWDDFSRQKIAWIELTDHANFCLDSEGYYLNNTVFFLVGRRLPYILAFLNSKLCEWHFTKIAGTSGVGTRRWIKQYIEQICIPDSIPQHNEDALESLVFEVQSRKKKDQNTVDLENKIDEIILQLFDFSVEEINYISNLDLAAVI
ncbi:MAG TPA: Eco57I restriction-modification methylase domain-containing protein [Cyclobacteriaceae bacterium]|nr:Eco57I restriction-modification methylase domain-containing protein [Cyclobacteriaceae bacterium]